VSSTSKYSKAKAPGRLAVFRLQGLLRYIFLTHSFIITLVHYFVYPSVPDFGLARLQRVCEPVLLLGGGDFWEGAIARTTNHAAIVYSQ
jgi:hypothetical protein